MAGKRYSDAKRAAILDRWHAARKRGLGVYAAAAEAGVPPTTIALWTRGSRKPVPKGTKRPCLGCGETFTSEGYYQRLCRDCRKWTDGLPPQFV